MLRVQQEVAGITAVGCCGVEVPGSGSSQRLGEKVGLRTGQPTGVGCQHLIQLDYRDQRGQPFQDWRLPLSSSHHRPLRVCQ